MARIRQGHQSVLLVVDAQVGVMAGAWDAARVIAKVAQAVERARAQGVPVLWVQHADEGLPTGGADWQWVPELAPAPGETLIHKNHNSAFEDTPLEAELARCGASHLVLAGAATNWCIRATAYAALERGYDLTLLRDAHTTDHIPLDDGSVIDAANVVAELNIAMSWLGYPGRRNRAVFSEDIDFLAPVGPG